MREPTDQPAPEVIWPSVDVSQPTEQGGPIARAGFTYQDEIVVGFPDGDARRPHRPEGACDTHDDAIVIREFADTTALIAEYVQVKAEEPDQLWTVAALSEKKKTVSLFETSVGRDKHLEVARFRIVTLRQPAKALKPLTYAFDSEARAADAQEMVQLQTDLETRFPDAKSPKGNGCGFWLAHCHWDVRYDHKAVINDNRRRLMTLAMQAGCTLMLDQLDALLEELRLMAKIAGDAKWVPDRAEKIVTRARIITWWTQKLEELVDGAKRAAGGKLAEKLAAASLPDEIIALALEMRLDYAAAIRTPRYQESDDVAQLQWRVG